MYDKITGAPINNLNINSYNNVFPVTSKRNKYTPEIIEIEGSQKSDDNMSFSEIFNSQGTGISQGSRISSVNSSPVNSFNNEDDTTKYIAIPLSDNKVDYSINTEHHLVGNPDSNRFGRGGKNTRKKK